jgi:hypothetical protein
MTVASSSACSGLPWKMISPRSMAYSRSAMRAALIRFDSAISSEMPRS